MATWPNMNKIEEKLHKTVLACFCIIFLQFETKVDLTRKTDCNDASINRLCNQQEEENALLSLSTTYCPLAGPRVVSGSIFRGKEITQNFRGKKPCASTSKSLCTFLMKLVIILVKCVEEQVSPVYSNKDKLMFLTNKSNISLYEANGVYCV